MQVNSEDIVVKAGLASDLADEAIIQTTEETC